MIELKNLSKAYGKHQVLNDISFSFDCVGSVYTIIGESGSGKTTLFNILYGIDQQYHGQVYLDEHCLSDFSSSDWDSIRNRKIGIVFQDYKLLEGLTVYDNLKYAYAMEEDTREHRIHEVLCLLNLEDTSKQKAGELSGGQKQRLAIGRAILNNPDILLLDEPTGNLDNDNIDNIMEYISKIKHNKIIIMITHDDRLKKYSDFVLMLKDTHLTSLTDPNKCIKKMIQKSNSNKVESKPKIWSYFLHSSKGRIKDLIMNNIPVTLIICIFICLFGFISNKYNQQTNTLFQGLSDQAIYISSSNFTSSYLDENKKLGITKSDDGVRINFSEDDLEKVKKIPEVKSATLYNSSNISTFDNEENKLNLLWEKDSYPEQIKVVASYSSAPSTIDFVFQSMNIPQEYAKDFNKINLLYGDFPKQNSNQIIIPDILAIQYHEELEKCLKQTIALPVYDIENNKKERNYEIVGIYKSDYENHINSNYAVYVNYMQYDFLDLFLTNDQYNSMKRTDFEMNQQVVDYQNDIYNSYESYKKAIGTNLGDMIILANRPEDVRTIQLKLEEIFPNLRILSQYELSHGETAAAFHQIKTYIYLATFAFSLLLGFIVIFLNKSYIKSRNKELAILYALGYSRKHIAILISLEYLFTLAIDLGLAFLILKLIQLSRFNANDLYSLFDQIFQMDQIFIICMFMFVMITLSALFSLYGINKKKLRKFLEGRD